MRTGPLTCGTPEIVPAESTSPLYTNVETRMAVSPPNPDRSTPKPSGRRGLSLRKRLAFSLITVTAFFVLLEGTLALVRFPAASGSEDPFVGFAGYRPLFVPHRTSDGTVQMATAKAKLTWFNDQRFPREKGPTTIRIFCLGGSTTYGRPYDDATSFCGWLREFLSAADPSRHWEVINAGGISYASYRVARLMEELVQYEPDLFIVYTGQNEFLERRTYSTIVSTPESLRGVAGFLMQTRTASAMRTAFRALRRSPAQQSARFVLPSEVTAQLDSTVGLDAYERDDELTRGVVAHFGVNLRRIVKIGREAGAEVIFVSPASNLADCAPFKSEHSAGLSPEEVNRCNELLAQVRAELKAERAENALPLAKEAVEADPRYADAQFLYGRCLLTLGHIDEARRAFIKARDEDVCPLRALSSMYPVLLTCASEMNVPLVNFEQMVDGWSQPDLPGEEFFLDHVHPTIEAHRRLALALFEKLDEIGLVQPAASWGEETIQGVTERVEGNIDAAAHGKALVNLSKTLGWAGRRDEADRLALKAIELLPDNAAALYQAGNAFYERGELQLAERTYRRVLELDPGFAAAWYGLGQVASDRGDPQTAAERFAKALRIDPDFGDAHYNLGHMLLELGRDDEAVRHFQRVVELQPGTPQPYNTLGAIAANSGDLEAAKGWFQQAVKVAPNFVEARVNLGRVYHEQGMLDQAAHQYKAALQHDPEHPTARELMRRLEAARGPRR